MLRSATTRRSPRAASYFGDFDPFGDFDLLFGAARLGLKIVDLPVRYRARAPTATTNICRFRHGLLLFRMTAFAFRKFRVASSARGPPRNRLAGCCAAARPHSSRSR